eukprot:snap_masked-scaffold_39-processed-gene-2.13-mRNA-1 protein AED:1.00 eAED:1.00 QI:0/-1/0/0/-1/1/1/0/117
MNNQQLHFVQNMTDQVLSSMNAPPRPQNPVEAQVVQATPAAGQVKQPETAVPIYPTPDMNNENLKAGLMVAGGAIVATQVIPLIIFCCCFCAVFITGIILTVRAMNDFGNHDFDSEP